MELREYWHVLRRWLWLIVLAPAIAGATALAVSLTKTPVYAAEATVAVIPSRAEASFGSGIQSVSDQELAGVINRQERRNTLAALAQSPTLAERAWNELSAEIGAQVGAPLGLAGQIDVETERDNDLITIRARHEDPVVAAAVANAWADAAVGHINELFAGEALSLRDIEAQVPPAKGAYDGAQSAYLQFLADLQRAIGERQRVIASLTAAVAGDTSLARSNYEEAQKAYTGFVRSNEIPRLEREIAEREQIVGQLRAAAAVRTSFADQELKRQQERLARLYAEAARLEALITQARSLRDQVATTGENVAPATADALALLLLQASAYTSGASVPLQLQVEAGDLVGSQLDPADVDALIVLVDRRTALEEDVRRLSAQIVRQGGAPYLFEAPSSDDPLMQALAERYPSSLALPRRWPTRELPRIPSRPPSAPW